MYYDYYTKNENFLEMSRLLAKQGIKNCNFMLKTIHDELLGIDPYSENLSENQKQIIVEECQLNIWYFLREVVRIPVQGGGTTSFFLNKSILAQLYLYSLNTSSFLQSVRSTYITTTLEAICLHRAIQPNSYYIQTGHTGTETELIAHRISSMRKLLPSYVPYIYGGVPKKDSKRLIAYNDLEYFNERTLNTVGMIGSVLKDISDVSNDNYVVYIINSIVNDDSDKNGFTKCLQDNLANGNIVSWHESLYDKPELLDLTKLYYIKYDIRQLGFDVEYINRMYASLNREPDVIRRELYAVRLSDVEKNKDLEEYINWITGKSVVYGLNDHLSQIIRDEIHDKLISVIETVLPEIAESVTKSVVDYINGKIKDEKPEE